jgi:hypothetical protein
MGGDDLGSRCQMGLDMFERARCGPGPKQAQMLQFARAELEPFDQQCKDAASVARVRKLEGACMAEYRDAVAAERVRRRKLRATYVAQVSDLLLDPAYPPAYDAYKEQKERAFNREPGAKQAMDASLGLLADLAQKHGIAPQLGPDLQLW